MNLESKDTISSAARPENTTGRGDGRDRSVLSKTYYDGLASEFDELNDYWSNPYDSATWDKENALVGQYLGSYDLLLDLGVGFYPHIESTSEKQLVCVDISKQSLRVARRVYHHFNERMEYLCSDAIMLPFSDGSVEGIIAGGELINHVNGEKLLREIRRVLKPRGRAVVSVAMKWCLDSLYSVSDSYLGGKIGYSMTREEATQFLLKPRSSTDVTWEVTPNCNLQVTLYSCRELQEILSKTEFGILRIESLNLLSGIVPLPIQQDSNSMRLLQNLTKMLLLVDNAFLGKIPALRWFAGNVYLVLERP